MPTNARHNLAEIQPNNAVADPELQGALDKVVSEGYDVTKKPASRKRKSDVGDDINAKKTKTTKSGAADPKNEVPDISKIHLDGEEANTVEVYDNCDMVRSKIKLFVKQHPKETNASLARHVGVPANGLSRFYEKKGYDKGNTSAAFYKAYVYFEKLRIAQNKPKSKDRIKMEQVWGNRGGFNVVTASNNKGVSCSEGDQISCNRFGEVTLISAENGRARNIGAM